MRKSETFEEATKKNEKAEAMEAVDKGNDVRKHNRGHHSATSQGKSQDSTAKYGV